MRILFFSSIFPRRDQPNLGIYCHHLCRAWVAAGHDVRIVSPWPWTIKGHGAGRAPESVRDLQVEYPTYWYPPGIARRAYGWFMWRSSRGVLRRILEEFKPQCVVSYWSHPDGAVAALAAREAGIPSAVITGGSDVLVLPKQNEARKREIVRALQANDVIVAVSRDLREAAIALGAAPEKVRAWSQGIDDKMFRPGDRTSARQRLRVDLNAKVLLFVGNLVPVKGIEVLLDAFAQLFATRPDLRLFLLGEGPLRQMLEQRAASLGIADGVKFCGAVPHAKLPDWYRAADLTVLSSHSEGIPNVLRESLACGTPFVATDVGGIKELCGPPFGRLVPPADPGALAQAIEAALDADVNRAATETLPKLANWHEAAEQLLAFLKSPSASGMNDRPGDLRDLTQPIGWAGVTEDVPC